jgi:hypothetical protein
MKVNVTEVGLLSYSVVALGGPNNHKASGTRYLRVCNPLSIMTSFPLVKKQTNKIGSPNMEFVFPLYTETDPNCPSVTQV